MKHQLSLLVLSCLLLFAVGCGKKTKGDKDAASGKAGRGCEMKQEVFDKASVFEPLSESKKNSLPARVSLEKYAPKRKNQGSQGSCVAFSSCYAGRTILEAVAHKTNPNDVNFSPAYIYNQIKVDGCGNGSYVVDAMTKLKNEGVLPWNDFPYRDDQCSKQPTGDQKSAAGKYKTLGFNRLTKSDKSYEIDLKGIKQNIAQGAPVVIAMPVGGTFYELYGKKLWRPSESDYEQINRYKNRQESSFGGHAMCLIGYDDNYEGGSVQIMNSWGEDFGDKGFFWITYKDFSACCREAYGFYPMGSIKVENENVEVEQTEDFEAEIGLYVKKEDAYIPFKYKNGYTFSTTERMPKGMKFKIELTNKSVCYAYVIGQETDGSSYVLFPYTAKHSPYCGITGTRLFPKDESMKLDDIGKKDYMGIILSKEEIDITEINKKISNSNAPNYEFKVREALGREVVGTKDIKFSVGEDGVTAKFVAQSGDKNCVFMVMEINKE